MQYYWTCSNQKGNRGRISAQPCVSSGRARHEMCMESGAEGKKENSVKFEVACP